MARQQPRGGVGEEVGEEALRHVAEHRVGEPESVEPVERQELAVLTGIDPRLLERELKEPVMERRIVRDRQRRPRVEPGDERHRERVVAGVPAELGRQQLRLAVEPPPRRGTDEAKRVVLLDAGLEVKELGQVSDHQRLPLRGRGELVPVAERPEQLVTVVGGRRGQAGAEVGGEGADGARAAGVGEEHRPERPVPGRRADARCLDRGHVVDGECPPLRVVLPADRERWKVHRASRRRCRRRAPRRAAVRREGQGQRPALPAGLPCASRRPRDAARADGGGDAGR